MNSEQAVRLHAFRQTVVATGEPIRIGRKVVRGFVEEVTSDEVEISGGRAESGGFRAHVAVEDLQNQPQQMEEIEANGTKLKVLSVVTRSQILYEITAGDPAEEAA